MENPFKHISPLRIGVSSHHVIIAILLCPSNVDVTFSLDSQSSTNTMDEMKNHETKTILTVISDYFSFGNYTFPIFVYIVPNLLAIPFYLNKKLFVTPEVKEFKCSKCQNNMASKELKCDNCGTTTQIGDLK